MGDLLPFWKISSKVFALLFQVLTYKNVHLIALINFHMNVHINNHTFIWMLMLHFIKKNLLNVYLNFHLSLVLFINFIQKPILYLSGWVAWWIGGWLGGWIGWNAAISSSISVEIEAELGNRKIRKCMENISYTSWGWASPSSNLVQ